MLLVRSLLANNPNSRIAQFVRSSVQFNNSNSSFPTDGTPATLALITGSSPKTHGLWFKNFYERDLYPPGSNCTGPIGASIALDESIDVNATALDGGCPGFLCEWTLYSCASSLPDLLNGVLGWQM